MVLAQEEHGSAEELLRDHKRLQELTATGGLLSGSPTTCRHKKTPMCPPNRRDAILMNYIGEKQTFGLSQPTDGAGPYLARHTLAGLDPLPHKKGPGSLRGPLCRAVAPCLSRGRWGGGRRACSGSRPAAGSGGSTGCRRRSRRNWWRPGKGRHEPSYPRPRHRWGSR